MKVNENIVLYDGDCGFCSFWVQWLLNKDKEHILRFASLQGDFGQGFLQTHQMDLENFDTIIYITSTDHYYTKSSAILNILKSLGNIYSLLYFFILVPKFIRDFVYDLIAKNRKKLMNVNCLLPTPQQRKQFLD